MGTFTFKGKSYEVDDSGFLKDRNQWDENFAEGMAKEVGIPAGLSEAHWEIIRFIRHAFDQTGACPLVYHACREHKLFLRDLKRLFPTGYFRGACKLAGLTYKDEYVKYSWAEKAQPAPPASPRDKVYRVDGQGFLVDPSEWDQNFAANRAREMKIPGGLNDNHWKIINYLREAFAQNKTVPTVYETCEQNSIELADLEKLFPDGYHRGAIKIAGLRLN
ncbi:MAG TPA: TusE/DsrC/DsvC family sulfur relay protein [bacterium]|nr:TusE/DsrC/DsvC family sulfur relay protein [bacterium]